MEFRIREATQGDEPFLLEMLYEALFVPVGSPPFPTSVVDHPDLSRYARGFGHQEGDRGWIAESSAGNLLGAAWVRQMPSDDPGYGFVADDIPELSIAVVPDHRSGCRYGASWEPPRLGTSMQSLSRRSEPCSLLCIRAAALRSFPLRATR